MTLIGNLNLIEVDQMMIQMRHPNLTNLEDIDDDSENPNLPKDKNLSLVKMKRIREKEEMIAKKEVNTLLSKNFKFKENFGLKLNLDLEGKKMAEFVDELVLGLDLTIQSSGKVRFLTKTSKFAHNIAYDTKSGNAFRNEIISNKGYLYSDKNYFFVDDKYTTDGSKVVTLINSRVILFWRGVDLEKTAIKRILTLGLSYLIKKLTYAELYFNISEIIPNGDFDVSIRSKDNTFVLIGVERHPFLY
jgi:hypothetical protein